MIGNALGEDHDFYQEIALPCGAKNSKKNNLKRTHLLMPLAYTCSNFK